MELWQSLGAPVSHGLEMRFSGLERLDPTSWKVAKGAQLSPKAEA